jgi:RHS repeat-associated protein
MVAGTEFSSNCTSISSSELINSLVAYDRRALWDVLFDAVNVSEMIAYFKLSESTMFHYTVANQHPQWYGIYQNSHNLYSTTGTGMESYFGRIKDQFGQIFYDNLIAKFLNASKTYIDSFRLTEQVIYGSSRLGIYQNYKPLVGRYFNANQSQSSLNDQENISIILEPKSYALFTLYRGNKRYELSNHLGNVLTVITDKCILSCIGDTVSAKAADIASATDYSPFGAPLAGRVFSSNGYRYGFNSMEKDDETYGGGNAYDFGARIYSSRLGWWLSVDPLQVKYPGASPYMFSANCPISMFDPDGRDGIRNAVNASIAANMIYIYNPATTTLANATAAVNAAQTNIQTVWSAQIFNNRPVTVNLGAPQVMTLAQYNVAVANGTINSTDGQTNVITLTNTGRSATGQNTGTWNINDLTDAGNTAAHEFGHLVGLADRYQYIQAGSMTTGIEPQWASVFLPQAQANNDAGYIPNNNLMSNMSATLSAQQLNFVFSSGNRDREKIETYTFITAQNIPGVFTQGGVGGNMGNLGVFGFENDGNLTPPSQSPINRNIISGLISSRTISGLTPNNIGNMMNTRSGIGQLLDRNQNRGGRLSSGSNTISNLKSPYR